jgi:uncharacterized membrane protein
MTETTTLPDASPARFDAILYPSRSLPQAGFAILMGAVVLVSGFVGAGFALIGAWPVTGFLGLDVLLLYLAFRWNYRESRRAEFIRLDGNGLVIRRIEPGGRAEEWHFDPYWARLEIEEARPGRPTLRLLSHGRQITIGAFLGEDETREVAEALRGALRAHRAGDPV